MARSFSTKDAKEYIRQTTKVLTKFDQSAKTLDELESKVKAAADTLVMKEATVLLKGIPIDAVNREHLGIKIKPLRDNGFETVADISGASTAALERIDGIGKESAKVIHKEVKKIVRETAKNSKIKLSADNKTPETTALIVSLSKYLDKEQHINDAYTYLCENSETLHTAVTDLTAAAGGLKWVFASGEKKQKAESAFVIISEFDQSEIPEQAGECLKKLSGVSFKTDRECWQEFEKNPIAMINLLEKIAPGVIGTDDAVYGLPEELAEQVKAQPFVPDGLNCTLRSYQEWGVKYILRQGRVLLGDEMGLGKTVQAIAVMVSLRNTGSTHFMVVCPASVVSNWCREIAKFSDLKVVKIHGSRRDAAFDEWKQNGGVAVTTFETTEFIMEDEAYGFSLLVVDEAHYIKNPEALRTKNVKRISKNAKRILFMTGTALENRVDEMINLIEVLQPKVASTVKGMAFLSSAPQFREAVAPVYYRRRREDVLTELPELIETQEWCVLGRTEESEYERTLLSGNYAAIRRVSWNVPDLNDSSKAKRLLEIAEEAEDDGRKIIVFSFFLDTIRCVRELLGDKCSEPINGSVPPERRQEIVDEFNKAPAGSVLVAQIQSGGTGLNIQSASVVILCEPQFKPSIENQAISRAYRMGQTRNVLVYRLLGDDTVDEKIIEMLKTKQQVFDAFADESVAADETLEIDEATFGSIIKEEQERVKNQAIK